MGGDDTSAQEVPSQTLAAVAEDNSLAAVLAISKAVFSQVMQVRSKTTSTQHDCLPAAAFLLTNTCTAIVLFMFVRHPVHKL